MLCYYYYLFQKVPRQDFPEHFLDLSGQIRLLPLHGQLDSTRFGTNCQTMQDGQNCLHRQIAAKNVAILIYYLTVGVSQYKHNLYPLFIYIIRKKSNPRQKLRKGNSQNHVIIFTFITLGCYTVFSQYETRCH